MCKICRIENGVDEVAGESIRSSAIRRNANGAFVDRRFEGGYRPRR
jgi:hypothetical protein